MEYLAANNYKESLIVVADKDFEPYSFFNEKKEAVGYDVEMINSLSHLLKKNINLKLLSWEECVNSILNNEADLVLGVISSTKKAANFQVSIPTSTDKFIFFGKKKYEKFEELYTKKIAYLKGSDSLELFLKPYKLEKNALEYSYYENAFNSVLRNENDYVLATYSVGKKISKKYKGIKMMDDILVNKMFSIGVSEKNNYLVEELNNAILQRKRDGTIRYLKKKWLNKYVRVSSFGEFIKENNIKAIIFMGLIFAITIYLSVSKYIKKIHTLKEQENKLLENLTKDLLTNLYNRISGEELIKKTIEKFPTNNHAFIMIDIDDFKNINERLGHDGGDKILKKIGSTLKNISDGKGIAIRMGGDEFSIFIVNYKDIKLVEKIILRVFESLNEEIVIKDKKIKVSLSAGIASYPKDANNFDELYEKADKALYQAKTLGKKRYYKY